MCVLLQPRRNKHCLTGKVSKSVSVQLSFSVYEAPAIGSQVFVAVRHRIMFWGLLFFFLGILVIWFHAVLSTFAVSIVRFTHLLIPLHIQRKKWHTQIARFTLLPPMFNFFVRKDAWNEKGKWENLVNALQENSTFHNRILHSTMFNSNRSKKEKVLKVISYAFRP